MNNPKLIENLRVIPDFPKPGIMFQDISTLFDKAECLKIMCDETVDLYKDKGITKIVGIESRGFLLASAVFSFSATSAALFGLTAKPTFKSGITPLNP